MSPSPGPGNSDRFRQYLENPGRDIEPDSGFFSPDTVFWRVSREPALLLAGMRALLLQNAHPKIAQGVAGQSRYREDPLGRGIRTFSAVYSLVFGRRDEAIEAAMRVRSVHDRVHGQVMGPTPAGVDSSYDANDPELLLWVAATLLDSSVVAYELFIEPLSAEEKEQFYQQAKRCGQLFGIPEQRYPGSWANFQNWWQRTRDWVVIYFYDDQHHEGQHTVVTEIRGPLTGRRIVRGRESECLAHYAHESPATTGKA